MKKTQKEKEIEEFKSGLKEALNLNNIEVMAIIITNLNKSNKTIDSIKISVNYITSKCSSDLLYKIKYVLDETDYDINERLVKF